MNFLDSLGGQQRVMLSQSESSQAPSHLFKSIPRSPGRCRGGAKQSSQEQEEHAGLRIRIPGLVLTPVPSCLRVQFPQLSTGGKSALFPLLTCPPAPSNLCSLEKRMHPRPQPRIELLQKRLDLRRNFPRSPQSVPSGFPDCPYLSPTLGDEKDGQTAVQREELCVSASVSGLPLGEGREFSPGQPRERSGGDAPVQDPKEIPV